MPPDPDPQYGHDAVAAQLARLVPEPETDGEKIMKWFDKLFQNIIVVASPGAGFQLLGRSRTAREDTKRSLHSATGQHSRGSQLLLFVLAVTLCSALSSSFHFDEGKLAEKLIGQSRWTHSCMAAVSFTVQALVLGGFLAASVAVAAFSRIIGYTAIGITTIAAIILLVWVVLRLMSVCYLNSGTDLIMSAASSSENDAVNLKSWPASLFRIEKE